MLKSTLEKLALVGVITVDPKVQAQELTQSVGEEITKMIAQQKELEKRFEELVSAQHVLRNLPNKSKLRENQVSTHRCMQGSPGGMHAGVLTICTMWSMCSPCAGVLSMQLTCLPRMHPLHARRPSFSRWRMH